ncbi:MAG: DNA repair protein RecO, partial [Bacteroidota bacterium]
MIGKTEGIVLRTLPYQDSNMITTLYTRESGIKSFILKGYRSTRARAKHSFFQPLSIVDLVYFYKENQSLHKVRESKLAAMLQTIQTEPVKLSLGLAIVEVFYLTVKEEEPNPGLYHFLKETILAIDQAERKLIHIFIHFLLHLTQFLGFFPLDMSEHHSKVAFDVKNGKLEKADGEGDPISGLLKRFLHADREAA